MKGQNLKLLFSFALTVLFLGTLLTTFIWYTSNNSHVEPPRPPALKKTETRSYSDKCKRSSHEEYKRSPSQEKTDNCNGCSKVINEVLQQYLHTWTKQKEKYQHFSSQLNTMCHASDKAFLTQANSPVGSKIRYDGDNRVREVTPELFSTFMKESPFLNKTWDTCAVVGNGGILTDSCCGDAIDSAQLVIRSNLPPLDDEFQSDVGSKTDIVTANPTIFANKYGGLLGRRRPFVDSLDIYGNSMLVFNAFSFSFGTPLSMRALYAIEDSGISVQPVFFNPEYLQSITKFWHGQGLREYRLSTGLMMATLALEICTNVHLYGFWPFSNHPHGFQPLNHHYYDDKKASGFHSMPNEFKFLLQLHSQGVLRIHLGQCGQQ